MPEMGRYCKAYPVRMFQEFTGWKINIQNLRKEKPPDGLSKEAPAKVPKKMKEGAAPQVETPRALTDDDHLYLQENFVVTDGIFINDYIVFDDVTPEWLDFCKNTLKFEVPSYETVPANA